MNLSLCLGTRNNLEYLKNFYETTRKLYPDIEICICCNGNDTDEFNYLMILLGDENVVVRMVDSSNTFSDVFNIAVQSAKNDYVAYLHNDIILTPNFVENILKHLDGRTDRVVSYTTIEPPIFSGHNRPGKIIADFGRGVEDTRIDDLYKFSEEQQQIFKDKTEPGATFFLATHRKTLMEMRGLDNLYNPMFCEDDDLLLRFRLKGMELITSQDAICYHYVSKTSRFSDEYARRTAQIEANSNRNFIRKWGFKNSKYNKVFSIGYKIKNCTLGILHLMEPWSDGIEVDMDPLGYILNEQPNTKYRLKTRINSVAFEYSPPDIVVSFDANQFDHKSFQVVQNLQDIIAESGEIGQFKLDVLDISISALIDRAPDMICNGSS